MKVLKNYLYNASYQLLAIVVPIITTPYINRVLGPHGVGINTFTNTIIQYFILLGSIGIGLYGNRQVAYIRENKKKLSETFWEIEIVKIFSVSLSIIVFFCYLLLFANYKFYMLLQFVNLVAAIFDISWFFEGLEDFKRTVVRNTIVRILSTILIFLLVKTKNDTGVYILIIGCSNLFGNLTLWPYLRRILQPINLRKLKYLQHVLPSLSLFLPQVALQIYQVLNKTILGVMVSTNASGFYYDADTIIKMLLSLVTAIGTVMLPHMANEFANGNKENMKEMMYNSANITMCITFAFSFGIAAIATKFTPIFFGKQFLPVGPAMMLESPVIILAGISGVIGTQFLIPTDQIKHYTASLIIGAIISIILNFVFIPLWALNGAMIATVLSELSVAAYQIYYVVSTKQLKIYRLLENNIKYLIAGLVMFLVVYRIDKILPGSVLFLVLEVITGGIIYILFICILKTKAYKFLKEIIINGKR